MSPDRLYTIRELSTEVGRPENFIREALKRGLEHHRLAARGAIYITLRQWNSYLDRTLCGAVETSVGGRGRSSHPRRRRPPKSRRDPTAYADIDF